MCSRSWQGNWKGGCEVRVSERVDDPRVVVDVVVVEVLVDVEEVVVVEVVLEHVLPETLKFPCRPMAPTTTSILPVLFTWTVTVVVVPDTDRATKFAVRFPRALCK
jgi:hypothetical protein